MDEIRIKHLLDQFLQFYDQACLEQADAERRFQLWKRYYGFANVPPGEAGEQIAKEMLDYAWHKYSLVYQKIKYFEADLEKLNKFMEQVKKTLHYQSPIDLTVLFFVGTFETEPFVTSNGNHRFSLCIPVETDWDDFRLCQEITKVVHCCISGMSPDRGRTLAQVIFQEGMAFHTSQAALPEWKDTELLWEREKCSKEPNRIMINLLPYLQRKDYGAIYSFTKGTGASGYEKEAMYTGWIVIKYLLENDNNLNSLGRITKDQVDRFIEESLFSLLNHAYTIQPQE